MTREQALLGQAAEECAELAQRLSKAQRFGLREVQPDQPLDNHARILLEFTDLIAVLDLLDITTSMVFDVEIQQKQSKVERYLRYSIEQGQVQP